MRKARALQFAQGEKQRARALPDHGLCRKTQGFKGSAKLLFHGLGGVFFVKKLVLSGIRAAAQPLGNRLRQRRAGQRLAAAQNFRRGKAPQLGKHAVHGLLALGGGGVKRAGGHVAEAQAEDAACAVDAGKVIVAALVEHGAFRDGAGRDDADDVALDQTLCQRRILHLLADGDLVAAGDQTGDIALGGVEGHAAHGRLLLLFLAAVAGGQGEIQLLGGKARVLGEHLVKVAQTEKEDAVRVAFLDFQILPHHRRQLSHSLLRFFF